MNATNPQALPEQLLAGLASPDVHLHRVDFVRGAALLLRLDEAVYRRASFLDDRILGPTIPGGWLPLQRVLGAAAALTAGRPLHFVFHAGHVGSTLVSRLLDESGATLGLREPLPLRTLAEAHDVLAAPESLLAEQQFAAALRGCIALWSRGYPNTRAVVLKATSSAGRLAPRLLEAAPGARAVYLNLRAEPYLATLLAGANSVLDLRGHGPERIRRLQARTRAPLRALHSLSIGEMAALAWLAEACSQHDALRAHPERVLAIDFDALLADVGTTLASVATHLQLPVDDAWRGAVASSPSLGRYSKAPEHAYGPEVRAATLAEARARHADEIRRGLAWLDRMARADASLAEVVARGAG